MKNSFLILLSVLLFTNGVSQNAGYQYSGRYTPAIKKEKINKALFIDEIMPEFCRYVSLPHNERLVLKQLLEIVEEDHTVLPGESFYPREDYTKIMNYVSVKITATCHGKAVTTQSNSEVLTREQKIILNAADPGTDLRIKIRFNYKFQANFTPDPAKINEGEYIVTVVPATEAEFSGGFKQLTNYITQNIINKVPGSNASKKIRQVVVKFTVNEQGQAVDAKISGTSDDPKTDKLIVEAIAKMPAWQPAKNEKGVKVRQEFSIPLGSGC